MVAYDDSVDGGADANMSQTKVKEKSKVIELTRMRNKETGTL